MYDGFTDYYKVLNVEFDASRGEIRRGFHDAAMRWHPDLNTDSEAGSNEMMRLVNEAWEVLGDSSLRAEYDRLWIEHFRSVDEESIHSERAEFSQTVDSWESEDSFMDVIRHRTPIWVQVLIWLLVIAFIAGILAGIVWAVVEIVKLVVELVKFIIELLKIVIAVAVTVIVGAVVAVVLLGLGWLGLRMSDDQW